MELKTLLMEEISSEIKDLNMEAIGTDRHKTAVESIGTLVQKVIELDKNEKELYKATYIADSERYDSRDRLDYEKKQNRVNNFILIGTTLLTVGVTVWGTLKTFEFEKEGTVTTIMGRGFINKLLPKK